MKEQISKLRTKLSQEIILYPILIGVLFVTTELNKNWTISNTLNKILFALIILFFCIAINFIARISIKNKIKASLVAAILIVINLYYGYLFNWIYEQDLTNIILNFLNINHPAYYLLPIFAFIFCGLTFLIIKTKKKLFNLNLYLNVLICTFLFFEIGTIIFTEKFTVELIPTPSQHTGKLVNSIIKDKPNIYFILLDSYTSSESLKKYWKYDNSPFEDSLAKMGFFSTHSAKSDYDFTLYSMASYLNMSLLKVNYKKKSTEDWTLQKNKLLNLIEKNIVSQQIINSGYAFINYSIFEVGNTKRFYNTSISKGWESISSLLQTTFFWSGVKRIIQIYQTSEQSPSSEQSPFYPNLKIFELLKDSVDSNSKTPIFVYAHIMMPHHPFEYDEEGNRMSPQYRELLNNDSYLKQLRYTNTLIIETIQKILITDKKQPIIIIQGDHGYRFLKNFDSKTKRTEAHSIFSSYLYPEDLNVQLNDSIQPIQAFSLLFNKH